MKLSDRLNAGTGQRTGPVAAKPMDRTRYNRVKSEVHLMLVERLDLSTVTDLSSQELEIAVRNMLNEITLNRDMPLNNRERTLLVSDLVNEITGLGPLEAYINDDSVQDILVNGHSQVIVERDGILETTPVQFRDDKHLMHIIDKIVSGVGRRIDESSPMVDARLADGSRVNVIIPPLALDGPMMSIRKFGKHQFTGDDLMARGAMGSGMFDFLRAAIRSKLNILVSGGTGAGKTTLLNVLSENIPDKERIITIEDSAELRLGQPHVVRLESRPPNVEGKGEATLTDLVKNSLRMRPDRIIVGETRGGEVMDMLQAMNTGHPGSMSTIHANSPKDALSRMEVMANMGTVTYSETALKTLISSAIDIIVQLARLADGKRRVVSITEVRGLRAEAVDLSELFRFLPRGTDGDGNVLGMFKGTGTVPECFNHIAVAGIELDKEIFSREWAIQ
ncbi:MAG: CpaF family protein [Desulfobacter sp.]|nr:MAG: CpaF family protein [Desulfobacter sp.]